MFREPIDEPEIESSGYGVGSIVSTLRELEKKHGIILAVITRDDVEDAWNNEFLADDEEPPVFTDELWSKFRETYEWRKGFAEVMWGSALDLMSQAIFDFVRDREISEDRL